nr:uncharacterized protein LOC113717963 isoform X2 [Coffea arabica]
MVAVRNFLSLSSSLTYLQLVLFQFLFLLKLLEKDMSLSENCSTVLIHIVRRLTSQEVNKYGSPNLPDQRSIELRDATPKKKKQCHCKNSRCLKFITCYMQQNLEKWGSVCSCNGVRTSAIEFYKRVPWVFSHAPCPSV